MPPAIRHRVGRYLPERSGFPTLLIMAQDNDLFELIIGRPRSGGGEVVASRASILRGVARAGGNPRRLQSAVPVAAKQAPRTGRFNARGRGAKIAASLPRHSGWSIQHGTGLRVRSRRVTVKARIVKLAGKGKAVSAHLSYLERDGVTREGEPGRLYSTFTDEADRQAFIERGAGDRHQFRFILSPEDGAAYQDLKPFTRDVMAQMEQDLGTTLDWVAVDHHDTGHPHVHVVLRGVTEDGKTLNIAGDYIAHGIRYRASEILTRDLGPQTEREVEQQLGREVEAERFTRLDRALIERADNGVADLRVEQASDAFGRAHHQLLIGRARQLERMGLAERTEPLCWSLSSEAETTLRAMGERGDIIKTLHRAMTQAQVERSPSLYAIHDRKADAAPIIGRVVARGMADEIGDRRYLVIDGIDGRSHYVDIGEAEGSFRKGSIVSLSNVSTDTRAVDHTVAEIAAANGGRYNVDIHLRHDRNAMQTFAERHVRRLEAIRRATGGVERERDGTWIIAPDHLEKVRAYEEQRAQHQPVIAETLSPMTLHRQIVADAPTWLDQQIAGEDRSGPSAYGFGREVRDALVLRRQWLLEQDLATVEGQAIVARAAMLATLRRRELNRVAGQLSGELGLPYAQAVPGERIEGKVVRPVELASGRYTLIEKSREFTLVPWRPVLERAIGKEVSGIMREGRDIAWTMGRSRGLGI